MSHTTTEQLTLYMEIAEFIAGRLSLDPKRKVCAIAVKDNSILGYGINGTVSGWFSNQIPLDQNGKVLHSHVVHAEINLIAKLARKGFPTEGVDLFVNHAPCPECAKAIRQAGFRRVIYKHDYKSDEGLSILTQGNHSFVEVIKL